MNKIPRLGYRHLTFDAQQLHRLSHSHNYMRRHRDVSKTAIFDWWELLECCPNYKQMLR